MPELVIDFIRSLDRLQLLEYVPTVLAGPPGTTEADA
jgi:hypothetical protein